MCDWHIEKMRPEHLEQVLALESQCFPTLAWDAKCFLYEMEENPFGHYFIGYLNNEPVGYVGLHIIFETCHITTIGIHTNFRQQGYDPHKHMAGFFLYNNYAWNDRTHVPV